MSTNIDSKFVSATFNVTGKVANNFIDSRLATLTIEVIGDEEANRIFLLCHRMFIPILMFIDLTK